MNEVIRLRSDSVLGVMYADRTPFGGPIGVRADDLARAVFAPVAHRISQCGVSLRLDAGLANAICSTRLFAAIAQRQAGGWALREQVLHPPPGDCCPAYITAQRPGHGAVARVAFEPAHRYALHEAVSRLSHNGYPASELGSLPAAAQGLISCWLEHGIAEWAPAPPPPAARLGSTDLTFVGHNTVVLREGLTALMFDPYLHETSAAYPATYQPLQLAELGSLAAVVLTHAHRDHFDPASLLRIPPATTLIAPAVERESMLTVDFATRLAELGFTDVRTLHWGDTTAIGDIELRALPFYGEQPTDGQWLHPHIRNQGCTYLVTTPRWSAALLADAGADGAGTVKAVATRCRQEFGPVDVVFSGYRGWLTYPAQLLGSSIARYVLFIPPQYWGARMQLMSSADDALDVAERWGARYLCPYGDGGAPWHWAYQLGPRLDEQRAEVQGFDPFPESVAQAAAARSITPDGTQVGSAVKVLLLRPGDSLRHIGTAAEAERVRIAGHLWPYGEAL